MTKSEQIKEKLNNLQNEYHDKIYSILNKGGDNWDSINELQKNIINFSVIEREMALDKAKSSLEKAFTPKLKKMLSKKIQKEIDNG